MRLAPVDDMGLGHATVDGPDTGLHLGSHTGFQVRQHIAQVFHTDPANQRILIRPIGVQTIHISQDNELVRAHSGSQSGGGGISVHVEHFSGIFFVRSHGRDDRDTTGSHQILDCRGIDGNHVADQADIGGLAIDDGPALHGREQAAVFTGHAYGQRAVRVDQAYQFA